MKGFRRHRLHAAAICALLAVIHTWPLSTAPGVLSRNDNADAQLNEWILAWVAHQLPHAPARLFDANIFFPAKDTLAFSEPLILPGLMGAPFRWLGASPVLNFNIVLLLGFTLTALATYALVYEWTGDRIAALLAGSVFAFNTHTLTRLPHVQAMHAWGLPLALLATDRLIVSGRVQASLWLAVWMAAMAYTSGYVAVFGIVMVTVAVLARAKEWMPRARLVLSRFAVAAALGGVLMIPVYLPYRRVATEQGMLRSLENVRDFSLSPKAYLASAGRLHFSTWSSAFYKETLDPYFPGVIVIILAAAALWLCLRTPVVSADLLLTRRRVVMMLGVALAGFVLSLGTRTPVYGWLFYAFPPVQGLRAASRFGNLFLLGSAVLAGIGLTLSRRRFSLMRTAAVGVIVVAAVNAESLRAPLYYTTFHGIPDIYSRLATEHRRVVLVEIPFYPPRGVFLNAGYVLNSTEHWRPLINGYSGYIPRGFAEFAAAFRSFPDDQALRAMRAAGATHVMLHPELLHDNPAEAQQLMDAAANNPNLIWIASGDAGITLYRFR